MTIPDNLKQYDDPLFAGLKDHRREKEVKEVVETGERRRSARFYVGALAALAVVLSGVAYFLLEAQEKIDALMSNLTASQTQLGTVSEELSQSQEKLGTLEKGLDSSRALLQVQGRELTQYKSLYRELKDQQQEHEQAVQTLAVQKADQSEVAALQQETTSIKTRVGEASSQISELQNTTTQTRREIQDTRTHVSSLEKQVGANSQEIEAVKRSLEREYYNFELQKGGGYMKVFSVALSLKDVDFEKQRFDLYILAGGKAVTKKDQPLNEPVYFYVEGIKKPYEVVVTRVDRKYVVGYLSVPKG